MINVGKKKIINLQKYGWKQCFFSIMQDGQFGYTFQLLNNSTKLFLVTWN
jgi:hypothetical protein